MSDQSLATALENLFPGCSSFLEYGTGNSTIQAAKAGMMVFSVETDWKYFLQITEQLETEILEKKVWPFYCDIGPVRDWGYPMKETPDPTFLRYPLYPWIQAQRMQVDPELVLIDGRFRIASFVASYQRAKPGAHILFNNYFSRPHYQEVELISPVSSSVDDIALFTVTELAQISLNDEKIMMLVEHFLDPR